MHGSLPAAGLTVRELSKVPLEYMAMQRYFFFKYLELFTRKCDSPLAIMLLSIMCPDSLLRMLRALEADHKTVVAPTRNEHFQWRLGLGQVYVLSFGKICLILMPVKK